VVESALEADLVARTEALIELGLSPRDASRAAFLDLSARIYRVQRVALAELRARYVGRAA